MGVDGNFGWMGERNGSAHNANGLLMRLPERTELNETDSEVARWLVVSGGAFCVGL